MGTGLRKGEVCGACLGALMVLGMKYGQAKAEDLESRSKANEVSDLFLEKFSAENGSYICNQLLNCDVSTKEGLNYAIENKLFTEFCPKMVSSAMRILDEICSNKLIFRVPQALLQIRLFDDSFFFSLGVVLDCVYIIP